jgi:hypothetical protein
MTEPFATATAPGRCNCEDAACEHSVFGRSCDNIASGAVDVDGLGPVCWPCAQVTVDGGGAQYVTVHDGAGALVERRTAARRRSDTPARETWPVMP